MMRYEWLGMSAVLGYCFISAFSRVFVSNVLQIEDPITLSFYIFTLGALIFATANVQRYRLLFAKLKCNKMNLMYLNITTMGSWLFLAYPLKFIEPAIVSTITLGIGPILSLLLSDKLYIRSEKSFLDMLIAGGLFLVILFLINVCLYTNEGNNDISLYNKIVSLICCTIVGISIVVNGFQTRKLINNDFSSLDILMLRFILLIFVSGIITFIYHPDISILSGMMDRSIVFSALIFVVLPLFLIQLSMRQLKPITISMMIPLMPVLTYLFECYDQRLITFNHTLYAILMVFFLMLLATYIRLSRRVSA